MQGYTRITVDSPGAYDHLRIERVPTLPDVPAEHVLVRVAAAGVNYADCCIRLGLYSSQKLYAPFPMTPGFEFAGVIERVGDAVEKSELARRRGVAKVGVEVFGVARFYAYAEYVVVPWRQLFPRVPSWSPVQLAAFPAVFLTALYAIRHCARVEPGSRVLVHSASGGVGLALCQLLRAINCSVIVGIVGRPHKVAAARLAGATHVIDKSLTSSADLWAQIERISPNFDAVFDANGVETLRSSFEHVAPGGTLVVYGFHTMMPTSGGDVNIWSAPLAFLRLAWNWIRTPTIDPLVLTTANRTVSGFNLSYLFDKIELFETYVEDMIALMHAGKLTPPPTQEFDLVDVGSAHRALESAQTVGKMVLVTEFGRSLQQQKK